MATALSEARAALEQCLSALEDVESEVEGEAVEGEAGELRSALRSAVAEAAAAVVALEDETGEWEKAEKEEEEKAPPPPWAPGLRLDFCALAARHPKLAPFLVVIPKKKRRKKDGSNEAEAEAVTLDFTSHDACAALTSALLLEGCGIRNWGVPRGSLVPPLGVRDEYLRYVSKLICSSSSSSSSPSPASSAAASSEKRRRQRPRILDVGCGSNLVFCLLASSSLPRRRWRSVGLDASAGAIADARRLLDSNPHLVPLVELRQGPEEGLRDIEKVGILRHGFLKRKEEEEEEEERGGGKEENGGRGGGAEKKKKKKDKGGEGEGNLNEPRNNFDLDSDDDGDDDEGGGRRGGEEEEWFDATVCNPPFFSSASERAQTASSFAAGAWGGTDAEVVCPAGGEAAFVSKMIRESCERDFDIGRRVGWFTVFLGKKATLRAMVALLRGENEGVAGIGGEEEGEKGGEEAAATATGTAATAPLSRLGTSRKPALRWKALDEHGGRTTRWVLAWSWTQKQ